MAYQELVTLTTPTAYRLALRILNDPTDAQDVLQEGYIRVWRQLPTLRNTHAVAGWIYRICRNAALDHRRASGKRIMVPLEGLAICSDDCGPDDKIASAQSIRQLQEGMSRLKEKHRIVLLLREVDGMSCEAISESLGIPVGTVDSRLHRARKHLATFLHRAELREHARETSDHEL